MKRILITFIACVLIASCTAIPKKNDSKAPNIIKISANVWRIESRYSEANRIYLFKHSKNIDYQKLFNDVKEIEGIQHIGPEFYQLNITIARNYNWSDIEPEIIKILDNINSYLLIFKPKPKDNKKGL